MSSIPWRDMTDVQKELHRGHVQRWKENNKEQVAVQDQSYRESHKGQYKRWQPGQKIRYRQVKQEAIAILGGKCCRCKCDDIRCLEIDHIVPVRGDRSIYGAKLYRSIVSGGSTENLQVLCANCHAIKTYEDGNGVV